MNSKENLFLKLNIVENNGINNTLNIIKSNLNNNNKPIKLISTGKDINVMFKIYNILQEDYQFEISKIITGFNPKKNLVKAKMTIKKRIE